MHPMSHGEFENEFENDFEFENDHSANHYQPEVSDSSHYNEQQTIATAAYIPTTKAISASTPSQTTGYFGETFRFDIVNGIVTSSYENEHGYWRRQGLHSDEAFQVNGNQVTKTEFDDGRLKTEIYIDLTGSGLYTRQTGTAQIDIPSALEARLNSQLITNSTHLGSDQEDNYFGGEESEQINGYQGNDELHGLGGDDHIRGNQGNDNICGDAGSDWLYGGLGNDLISGGEGIDRLYGRDDNDTLQGNQGDDLLWGGTGDDIVSGGKGNDWLTGESGNDHLNGNLGNDILLGGLGADTFTVSSGQDRIEDFTASEGDRLELIGQYSLGQSGNDLIITHQNGILTLANLDLNTFDANTSILPF